MARMNRNPLEAMGFDAEKVGPTWLASGTRNRAPMILTIRPAAPRIAAPCTKEDCFFSISIKHLLKQR